MHRLSADKLRAFRLRYDRLLRTAVAVLLALLISVVFACCPLRTALPAFAVPAREAGELRVHFLDVGQGDSAIVEFPDGNLLVIDAGDGTFENENRLIRYLKALDFGEITYLATHADIDHFGGFACLIEHFPPSCIYLPIVPSGALAYRKFVEAALGADCELKTLSRYDVIENSSGAYLACISPYAVGEGEDNDSSAVLCLCYEGVKILFCSDISAVRERLILRELELGEGVFDAGGHAVRLEEIDILKVAHHGSYTSSTQEFLSAITPKEAVISCGRGNRYTHPFAESVARIAASGARIWRTDELGDVLVSVKESGYRITAD